MTRREKREKNKEVNLLKELVTIMKQYFPELMNKFEGLTDVRHQSYVLYKMKVIFLVRLLGIMCEMKTMQGMTREINTEEAIKNIAQISGVQLQEIPHCDTINDVFKKIKIEELEEVRKYMINQMIRSKLIKKYLVRDRYYHIIIDGTGLATSRKKYNENCLIKNKTDKNGEKYKEYSTYLLEAKLVVGKMVFSIGSEFVENVNKKIIKGYQKNPREKLKKMKMKVKGKEIKALNREKYKQDCELKAFKRLVEKIKNQFPRLKILIAGDALYANKTVIEICKEYGWKYIIRFKEGAIPTLYEEYTKIVEKDNESKKANYEFVTKIDYQDNKVNIIKYTEEKENKKTEFMFITDLPITNKNIESSIVIGRKRWKIENEGFNIQKNGTFDIGHLYSRDATAIKVHYLTIQMGHILRQLLEKGTKVVRELKLKIKEISHELKKMLISQILNLTEINKIQLRFDE